ncbi:MurR/RpiR family transcriptional regulator [Aerococcaceae bacterium WGS1372]
MAKIFIDLINKVFTELNENELSLSKYILENYQSIASMSVNELADNTFTSKSSVIRFCQKIGFSGFTELKNYIKWDTSIQEDQGVSHSMRNFVMSDIMKTLRYIEESEWTLIYEQLFITKKVYLIPTGSTQKSQASELYRLFLLINKRVEIIDNVTSTNEFKRVLELAESDSLFFLLSYSGENKNLIELQNQLILKNFNTVSVTSISNNTIARNSVFNLYAHTTVSPLKSEWWIQSSSAFFIMIEAFVYGYLDYLNEKERE